MCAAAKAKGSHGDDAPGIVEHYKRGETPAEYPSEANCVIHGPVKLLLGRGQGFILHVRRYRKGEQIAPGEVHVKKKSSVAEAAGYKPLCFVRDRQTVALRFPVAEDCVYDLAYVVESRISHAGTYTMKSAMTLEFPDAETRYEYEYRSRGQRWIDCRSENEA